MAEDQENQTPAPVLGVPSTAELDLARRLPLEAKGGRDAPRTINPGEKYSQETGDFIGVSQEYANFANDTDTPRWAEGGTLGAVEALADERMSSVVPDKEPEDSGTEAEAEPAGGEIPTSADGSPVPVVASTSPASGGNTEGATPEGDAK